MSNLMGKLPLRVSIPLMFFSLIVLLSAGSLVFEQRQADSHIEFSVQQNLQFLGDLLTSSLEQDFKHGDLVMAETRIQLLATNPTIESALLVDENDHVLFASLPRLLGEPVSQTLNKDRLFTATELQQIRETFSAKSRLDSARGYFLNINPVRLSPGATKGFAPPSQRIGLLISKSPLADLKAQSHSGSFNRLLASLVFLASLMIAAGWFLSRLITKRAQRLLDATDRLAEGDYQASAKLQGRDELSELSSAFDQLANELAEKATLNRDRLRLAEIVEGSTDLIGSTTVDGRLSYLNSAGRVLIGQEERRSIEGVPLSEFFSPESWQKISSLGIPEALTTGSWSGETEIRLPSGRLIPVSQKIFAHRNGQGKIEFLSTICRDLTERKENEVSLRQAIRARDEFLSIASHELKTPLAALKMQLQFSKKSLTKEKPPTLSPEKLTSEFNMALRQVESLTNLVDDLLDISRIQAGKFHLNLEKTNLAALVKDILNRYAEQLLSANCTVATRLEENVEGTWDHFRIEQILVNLLSNMIKYAPNCQATITVKRVADLSIMIFEDNGPGIPLEKQSKIFEPFERCNQSRSIAGLGLGLFVVKKIVQAHQGYISVESRPDQGTKFIIELPLMPHATHTNLVNRSSPPWQQEFNAEF